MLCRRDASVDICPVIKLKIRSFEQPRIYFKIIFILIGNRNFEADVFSAWTIECVRIAS